MPKFRTTISIAVEITASDENAAFNAAVTLAERADVIDTVGMTEHEVLYAEYGDVTAV